MGLITALLSLLSSSGLGVVLGHVFGWLNRREDLRAKEVELVHETKKWAHELLLRDKDLEQLKQEWAGKAQIASIEVEGEMAKADADAIRAAHEADKATYGTGPWATVVDTARGIVRPLLTAALVGVSVYVNYKLLALLQQSWPVISTAEKVKITLMALEWLFFQAGACIGFWFGSRGQPRVKA